jgi:hypothetical protein
MRRGVWLIILVVLGAEIAIAIYSIVWPYRLTESSLLWVVINSCILLGLAIFLFVVAIGERRFFPTSMKETLTKVMTGLVFVCLLSIPFVSSWSYQGRCDGNIGPCTNLVGCDFSGKDLSGLDLHQADLSEAILSNANLQDVNLSGAVLTGAKLNGADLTRATLDNAELTGANLENVQGLTDEMLMSALNVTEDELASTLSQSTIQLESRQSIMERMRDVHLGEVVLECANYSANESFHPVVLLDAEGNKHKWTDGIPRQWEPMALRFCELVAFAETEQEVTVETCSYWGGPSITRYRYEMPVVLMDAKTANVVEVETVEGERPSQCPVSAPVEQTRIDGGHVQLSDIEEWLGEFVNQNLTEEPPPEEDYVSVAICTIGIIGVAVLVVASAIYEKRRKKK